MSAVEEATTLKQKGNKAFSNHDWLQAIDFYSQAIDTYDKDPSFYCNRSQVLDFDGVLYLFSAPNSLSIGQYQA